MQYKSLPLEARVGCRIRECRSEKKMTQDELGMLSEISQRTISKIEIGAVDVRLSTVYWIAKALKTTLESLTWGSDK